MRMEQQLDTRFMETTSAEQNIPRLPLPRQFANVVRGVFQTRALVSMLSGLVTVAGFTLLAKAMSFFKDATVAQRFGTADELDAFVLAFSFLAFLASVLGGGLPEAFLPAFSEVWHQRGARRAQRLGVQSAFAHTVSLIVIGGIVFAIAPQIVGMTASGFSISKKAHAVHDLRHLMPFFIFYGMTLHFSTWLRAEKNFALAASAPLLPPLAIILCLLFTGKNASIETLIFGTLAGTGLHALVLGVAVLRRLPRGWRWLRTCAVLWEPQNRVVLGNALPYLLAGVILGSSVVVDQAMAAWLQPGSVSVLNYSDKVCSIVLALTATAASEALFPYFADSVARREWALLKKHLLQLTALMLVAALPMALGLVFFSSDVVRLLFERGSFGPEDTARVAAVLRFAALQIPFYITGVLASRVAVSLQATRFMLCASVAGMLLNFTLNALFMRWLEVAGIALSTAVVHLASAAALYVFIFRKIAGKLNGETFSPASPE